jgi:hypothetical protein
LFVVLLLLVCSWQLYNKDEAVKNDSSLAALAIFIIAGFGKF